MQTLTINVSDELGEYVKKKASANLLSKAAVVRTILLDYVRSNGDSQLVFSGAVLSDAPASTRT